MLNWWLLFGGVALFVFAMSLLEGALQELAGRSVKRFLQKQSEFKLRTIASGAIVTALLQSSSVVLLIILSFVGAGIMELKNALLLMLGANLGTTLDSWVVATLGFKVELDTVSYPLLVLALLLSLVSRRLKSWSQFIAGLALLFIGLEWMKISVAGFVHSFDLSAYRGLSPFLFIPIGLLITAIIQSSSATIAITLAALHSDLIPFESAAAIVIGSEIGTTLKILLASINGLPDKRRVATGNFIFNIALSLLAAILLFPLTTLVTDVFGIEDKLIALVTFQTGINVMGILLAYPFIDSSSSYLQRLFKNDDEDVLTRFISNKSVMLPSQAIILAEKEMVRLTLHVIRLNQRIFDLRKEPAEDEVFLKRLRRLTLAEEKTADTYKKLKILHGEILEFLVDQRQETINSAEVERIGALITVSRNIMRAAKRIKDIEHNIRDLQSSASVTLQEIFNMLKLEEMKFYDQLLMQINRPVEILSDPDKIQMDSQQQYKVSIEHILKLLGDNRISELDSSTLLNVYREVYSSHKSLLEAMALLQKGSTDTDTPEKEL